jgi:flavodoxin
MEVTPMNSLVIYCSHKGNTEKVARRIADALQARGRSQVMRTDEVPATIPPDVDLVFIGGPTEGHGMTPEMIDLLDRLDRASLRGRAAAAFDTRVDWPRMLSGSAGDRIAARLRAGGVRVVGPVGSFIVSMAPELKPGELDRAATWAAEVAENATLAAAPA